MAQVFRRARFCDAVVERSHSFYLQKSAGKLDVSFDRTKDLDQMGPVSFSFLSRNFGDQICLQFA